jgi:hypothetical protein
MRLDGLAAAPGDSTPPAPLAPVHGGGELSPAGDGDRFAAQVRLWQFLAGHTARYTMGESTSLPEETAAELLASALYTMGLDPDDPMVLGKLPADLDGAYRKGQRALERRTALTQRLWQAAAESMPPMESRSLSDTLRSIGAGFRRYDTRWFAREFSCDIDYQLCLPVSERLTGVDYAAEYLRHLLAENRFLGRFAPADCARVLGEVCPDYRNLLVNLYEPVAASALGAVLAGGEPQPLHLTAEQRETLRRLFSTLPASRAEAALHDAAERLGGMLGLGRAETAYLREAAPALAPRARAAADGGDVRGVFPG